jgi:hypothetical protein
VCMGFGTWFVHSRIKRKLRTIVGRLSNRSLGTAFEKWLHQMQSAQMMDRIYLRFAKRRCAFLKRCCFSVWAEVCFNRTDSSNRSATSLLQCVALTVPGDFDMIGASVESVESFDEALKKQICPVLRVQSDNVQVLCHERGSADGTIIAHVVLTADPAREKRAGQESKRSAVRLAKRLVRESVALKGDFSKNGEKVAACTAEVQGPISDAVLKSVKASISQQRQSQCALEQTRSDGQYEIRSSRAAQRVAYKLQRKEYAAAFARWHQSCADCKRLQRSCKLLMQWMRGHDAKRCLYSWQARTVWNRHIKTKLVHSLRRIVYKKRILAVAAWKMAVQQRKRSRAITARILKRWAHHALAAALGRWWTHGREQRRMKEVCGKVLMRMMMRLVCMGFVSWREDMGVKRKLRTIVGRLSNRSLGAALDCWVENAYHLRRCEGIRSRIACRWTHMTTAGAFQRWCELSRERRRVAEVCRKALLGLAKQGLRRALNAWAEGKCQRRRLRQVCGRIILHWTQRSSASAFEGWRLHLVNQVI